MDNENKIICMDRELKKGTRVTVEIVDEKGARSVSIGVITGIIDPVEKKYMFLSQMRPIPHVMTRNGAERSRIHFQVQDMDVEKMKEMHTENEVFPYEKIRIFEPMRRNAPKGENTIPWFKKK